MTGKDALVDQDGAGGAGGVDHGSATFVAAVTTLALDLLEALGDGRGNLALSPASLTGALAMVAPGARGATADEITGLFGQGGTARWLVAEASALERRLTAPAERGPRPDASAGAEGASPTLHLANDLWCQRGLPLREAYRTLLDRAFGASVHLVDYRTEPERSREAINDAIAGRTAGEITELLQPGSLTSLTRLVLTNAVYLEATWAEPFEPAETRPEPFHLLDGSTRTVSMLRRQDTLPYARVPGWQALRLDYAGRRLAMLLLLPDAPATPHPERALTAELLAGLRRDLRPRDVDLWLPKLRMEGQLDLNRPLARLGMRRAFTGEADFDALVDATVEQLQIDRIVQRTVVRVDEQGTVAAAATAVTMRTVAFRPPVDPVELRFDRPFLFLVQDSATGYPLFLTRVAEPPAA